MAAGAAEGAITATAFDSDNIVIIKSITFCNARQNYIIVAFARISERISRAFFS